MGPSVRAYMRRISVHFYISLTAKGREILRELNGQNGTPNLRFTPVNVRTKGILYQES